jgi:hypothetical protein
VCVCVCDSKHNIAVSIESKNFFQQHSSECVCSKPGQHLGVHEGLWGVQHADYTQQGFIGLGGGGDSKHNIAVRRCLGVRALGTSRGSLGGGGDSKHNTAVSEETHMLFKNKASMT